MRRALQRRSSVAPSPQCSVEATFWSDSGSRIRSPLRSVTELLNSSRVPRIGWTDSTLQVKSDPSTMTPMPSAETTSKPLRIACLRSLFFSSNLTECPRREPHWMKGCAGSASELVSPRKKLHAPLGSLTTRSATGKGERHRPRRNFPPSHAPTHAPSMKSSVAPPPRAASWWTNALPTRCYPSPKEDGEAGLQAIVDKHGPGTPFNWLAVVPDGAVWMTRADAADLRARVLSHVESVAPKLYRKWILARSSYTSRPK